MLKIKYYGIKNQVYHEQTPNKKELHLCYQCGAPGWPGGVLYAFDRLAGSTSLIL